MAYNVWSVIFGETPSASKWNILGTNDAGFNDGSALAFTVNNTIPANALKTNTILLGYVQIIANFSTSSSAHVQVTGLTATVTIPTGGRSVKITGYSVGASQTGGATVMTIWDGVVGSGTQLNQGNAAVTNNLVMCMAVVTPALGSKTYNIGLSNTVSATSTLLASSTYPAFILVELI